MSWHAETADEAFWSGYWRDHVNASYYSGAERHDLKSDELGQILLSEMPRHGKHLEAGCGAGYWVAALRAAGYDVEGIEYSRELVERVNQVNPDLPVAYGDALTIDRPDESYASYLSFGVVEHRREGPEPFLKEAYRVLEPGGVLIITIPFLGPVRLMKARLGWYQARTPEEPFFQYGFTENGCAGIPGRLSAGFHKPYNSYRAAKRDMDWN